MNRLKEKFAIITIILGAIIIIEALGYFNSLNLFIFNSAKPDKGVLIKILTDSGSLEAFIIYMAILYFGQALYYRHVSKNAVSFIIAVIVAMIATLFMKASMAVPRPNEVAQYWPFAKALIRADYFSFPSGHAVRATILAFYASFVFNNTKKKPYIKLLSWIYAFGIMYSRLLLQVHWFSDLLGGFVVGIWASLLVIYLEGIWVKIYTKIFNGIKGLRIS
ncbi:MAG: phosphatase PAP2 family protein [Caldisphaeraceae archaeon]|nr:phosphatase PAP2 family protein [Caldisphaeraceae archaeon]